MPSMVTSSWVGPMPPEVKTKSKRWENSQTSLPISGTSSWIVEIFCTSTPSWRNSVQKKCELMSWVLPDRTSLPMMTMPAVFAMIPYFYRNSIISTSFLGCKLGFSGPTSLFSEKQGRKGLYYPTLRKLDARMRLVVDLQIEYSIDTEQSALRRRF